MSRKRKKNAEIRKISDAGGAKAYIVVKSIPSWEGKMDKSRDFKIPISRTSSVIATVEMDHGTRVEKIIIHPLDNFNTADYVLLKITCGKVTVYSGELISSGMVITPEVAFFPKEDLTISLECLSLWESIMSGITSTNETEMLYCQFSIVTEKQEVIEIVVDDLSEEEFSPDFLEEWA